jgi:hypothetical protein
MVHQRDFSRRALVVDESEPNRGRQFRLT